MVMGLSQRIYGKKTALDFDKLKEYRNMNYLAVVFRHYRLGVAYCLLDTWQSILYYGKVSRIALMSVVVEF